ncbi:MAG TPA: hypothetical protein VFQ75_01640 [Candidatus Limnocylindrales bacterium]|jgi:hypothetical protein|nr:hypothetical protein [Candidatus Limnocylindrales bacterium]
MADDKGTSQLFGESLPGTGGDYIDTNDVEGHMGNKHITPMPPSADGGPDGIGGKGRSPIPEIDGTDTEGHRTGAGGRIPNVDGSEAGPEGIGSRGRGWTPENDGTDDVEGHGFAKRAPGENPHGDR